MSKKSDNWRHSYRDELISSSENNNVEVKSDDYNSKYDKTPHVRVKYDKNGVGAFFIGFEGQPTRYIDLSNAEKKDWLMQCAFINNFEDKINEILNGHYETNDAR